MSSFTCDHGDSYPLFGVGGGQALADEIGVELLGQVPIEPTVAAGGDAGEPVSISGAGFASAVFGNIADRIISETPTFDDMSDCSARDADVQVTVRRSQDRRA